MISSLRPRAALAVFAFLSAACVVIPSTASALIPQIKAEENTVYNFTPQADTWVKYGDSLAKGNATTLRADSFSPAFIYLKFNPQNLPAGKVASANIKLCANTANAWSLRAHTITSTGWGESSTTWFNRPTLGPIVDTAPSFAAGYTVSLDVTAAVIGNGTVSFGISSLSTTETSFNSREALTCRPTLQILTRGGSTDTTPPKFTAVTPTNGSEISGTVNVKPTVSDNVGLSTVEFEIDGVSKSRQYAAPYGYAWDTTLEKNTVHDVVIKAKDAAGNTSTTYTSVLVQNTYTPSIAPADETVDLVTLTSPTNLSTVNGLQVMQANASDASGIFMVEFLVDGTTLCWDTTDMYSCDWNTLSVANGTHTVSARAYDVVGNISSLNSATVTVAN